MISEIFFKTKFSENIQLIVRAFYELATNNKNEHCYTHMKQLLTTFMQFIAKQSTQENDENIFRTSITRNVMILMNQIADHQFITK
jgi:hypothetical protein